MIEILIIIHGNYFNHRQTFREMDRAGNMEIQQKFFNGGFSGVVSWPPSCGDYEIGGESPQIVGWLGWALHVFYWVSMESQQLHTAPSSPRIITIVYD